MNNKLGKGILIILVTNIINMVFSLITNFVLPHYLSYETYALIKTFQLYVSYSGIFHLGYSDGMYLHYGGTELEHVDKNKLSLSLSTMRIFQFCVAIVVCVISLLFNNWLLVIFSIDIFGYNLIGYFKNMFQAVGEFKHYAKITNTVAILNFALNMMLVGLLKLDNPYHYVICYTIVDMIAWTLLEIKICRLLNIKPRIFMLDRKELVWNIKDGILLLFGNLTSILITSMDRWFTKFLLTAIDFAQYSFAVSVENFLNVAITPITITLYNYLCKNPDIKLIHNLKNKIILFSSSLVSSYFFLKFILEVYLNKYLDSVIVIALLFASQMFYIIIKSIYVNLYKARMKQKKYFAEVLIVIIVGFLFNAGLFTVVRIKESFAIGTMLSAIVWFIICQIDFRELRLKLRELIYQIIVLIIFLTCAILFNSILGFFVYIMGILITALIFMRDDFWGLMNFYFSLIKNLFQKEKKV